MNLIAVLTTIVVVIIMATALMAYGSNEENDNHSDVDTLLTLEAGDFLEFTMTMGEMQQTMSYTVIDVTQTVTQTSTS